MHNVYHMLSASSATHATSATWAVAYFALAHTRYKLFDAGYSRLRFFVFDRCRRYERWRFHYRVCGMMQIICICNCIVTEHMSSFEPDVGWGARDKLLVIAFFVQ